MLAAKKHLSSKDETKFPVRANRREPESSSSRINPLWFQLATNVETPSENAAEVLRSPVQAKLAVGAPDDPYEKEADDVADMVMRMAEPEIRPKPT